jgi:hypothetical protein
MAMLFNIKQSDLDKLSLKDYFKTIEVALDKNNSVDRLTEFLTSQPYSETKPYLTRRQLKPIDKRFKQIELVYKDSNKVNAIVWDLNISLSQLKDIFGEPIIHNEPYSDSTAFAFRSKNKNIEIIKTRHPEWLTFKGDKKVFQYADSNKQKHEISDPEFSFVQYDIND